MLEPAVIPGRGLATDVDALMIGARCPVVPPAQPFQRYADSGHALGHGELERVVKLGQALGIELATELDDLYQVADFITVHMPVTEQTKGMLNAAAFAKMKPGVRIVNCARGEIIGETDLIAALDSGKVAAALMAKAPDLLARPPAIEKVDVLAAKLPR